MPMSMPGFTADRSLRAAALSYRSFGRHHDGPYQDRRRSVVGQADVEGEAAAAERPTAEAATDAPPTAAVRPAPEGRRGASLAPQMDGAPPCLTCGGAVRASLNGSETEVGGLDAMTSAYVFALGRIESRFPRLSVEKEFAQATGRAPTEGLTDREVLHRTLSDRQNRYLARQLCYVLTIEGIETYILHPREPGDLDLLIEAVRPAPRSTDVDVVVGLRGPLAPPEMCNGLMVPMVVFSQIWSFDVDALIRGIPRPEKMSAERFGPMAEDLFNRIMQMADNAGATDEHRALNYLAVRYPAIYATASDHFTRDFSLSGVEVRPSRLSVGRRIVDVIFSYTNRNTDVTDKYFVRVEVTEEFPFLVTKIQPFFER